MLNVVHAIITLSDIGNIGEAATAVGVIAAVVVGGRELRLRRKLERKAAVTSFVEKINSKHVLSLISWSVDYWGVAEDLREARWHEWRARSRPEQHDAFLAMNVFESLGAMYNDKLLDRRTVRRLLGDISLDYWSQVRWFVKRYQELDREALVEWERMNEDLARSRPAALAADGAALDDASPEHGAPDTDDNAERETDEWGGRERGRPWETGDLFLISRVHEGVDR